MKVLQVCIYKTVGRGHFFKIICSPKFKIIKLVFTCKYKALQLLSISILNLTSLVDFVLLYLQTCKCRNVKLSQHWLWLVCSAKYFNSCLTLVWGVLTVEGKEVDWTSRQILTFSSASMGWANNWRMPGVVAKWSKALLCERKFMKTANNGRIGKGDGYWKKRL